MREYDFHPNRVKVFFFINVPNNIHNNTGVSVSSDVILFKSITSPVNIFTRRKPCTRKFQQT